MSEQRIMQALFNQQRLQVLSLAKHHNEYTNDYVYAWERGVYPFFSDTDSSVNQMPHECYAEFFRVDKDTTKKVITYLDERFLAKKPPTFYELEDHFGGKWSQTDGRGALIGICRYVYLYGGFDESFWKKLLTPMKHPAEAASICASLDRQRDIYFM